VSVAALLAELRTRDVALWSDGNELRCNAPAGVLTERLRDQLRAQKAEIVRFLQAAEATARQDRTIVPLQPSGERTPVFAIGGHNGDVFCYRLLAKHLGNHQPFFGLRPPGLDKECTPLTSVTDLASHFAARIRRCRPDGPLIVAGYCAGGTIAFELAHALHREGREVERVALFAGRYPAWFRSFSQCRHRIACYVDRLETHKNALHALPFGNRRQYLIDMIRRLTARHDESQSQSGDPAFETVASVQAATMKAIKAYEPRYFPGRLSLFLPSAKSRRPVDGLVRWRGLAQEVEEYCGPDECVGDSMLLEPHVRAIAALFQASCKRNRIN
jgi:thioesterase domain-containing protein